MSPCTYQFRASRSAFTLIEVVAVLAIIAILAAVILPSAIRQLDVAAQSVEVANLQTMANGFQQGCLRQRYVPSYTNWDVFTASNIGWQLNAVQTNSKNNSRIFLVDPSMLNLTLPYNQNTNSAGLPYLPFHPRFIILSSLSAVPIPVNNASTYGTPEFNSLWNTPANTVPNGAGTSWTWSGKLQGADIIIQRVNLALDFSHLLLNNYDDTNSHFTIDNLSPAGGTANGYYLSGTVMNFYFANGGLEASQVLQQDGSWNYQCGIWRSSLAPAATNNGMMQSVVQSFYANTTSIGNPAVFDKMEDYLTDYSNYAASGFGSSSPAKAAVQSDAANLYSSIGLLIGR